MPPGPGGAAGLVNLDVGRLHQAGEQSGVRFSQRRRAESGHDGFHGGAGRDFSQLLPADSIRDGKKPAALPDLLERFRRGVTQDSLRCGRACGPASDMCSEFKIQTRG